MLIDKGDTSFQEFYLLLLFSGSGVIVEDFVYSGTLSIINPYSPVYHVVESDSGGMIPGSLKAVLSQWGGGEEAEPDRPKVTSTTEYLLFLFQAFYLFQALYPSASSVPSGCFLPSSN